MATDHPKRRRRRAADRSSVSGWLHLTEHLKGNLGRISQSLFVELFRHLPISDEVVSATHYVAITPWAPPSQDLVEDAAWSILPVQISKNDGEETYPLGVSSINFPASSLAFLACAEALYGNHAMKGPGSGRQGLEIRILEVEPLVLDAIYVTVDGDSLKRHEEIQNRFGGGFGTFRTNGSTVKGKAKAKVIPPDDVNGNGVELQLKEQEDRLTLAVRNALRSSVIVRQDDMLPLPLPAHPITHVPLPPTKISLCEPVSQGLISDATRIIVYRVSHAELASRGLPSLAVRKTFRDRNLEEGDDTANERFFSAAENGEHRQTLDRGVASSTSDSDNSGKDSDDSSDDPTQDMISMQAPSLTTQPTGTFSSRAPGTPRTSLPRANGVHTPGSVFSNFTATTARQGPNVRSRRCQARGLLSRIPDDLLHPKPAADEDEEARAFVDMRTLLRLGCFSGDWIQLEAAIAPNQNGSGVWAMEAFDPDDAVGDFRPVKVYGLSNLSQNSSPRSTKRLAVERRSSVLAAPHRDTSDPIIWLSPVLLANLGSTGFVNISPLQATVPELANSRAKSKSTKVDTRLSPPVAKEMTILRISSPVSTERALQGSIFAALKQHFELKRRVVRQGDLIALSIDKGVSKLFAQPIGASDVDQEVEELLSISSNRSSSTNNTLDIVWFRVGQFVVSDLEGNSPRSLTGTWGGAACVEPMVTRMRQAGNELSRIPSTLDLPWECYLGIKPLTKVSIPSNSLSKYVMSVPKPYIAPMRRRLRELLAAATSPRAVHLGMDPVIILLYSTQRNIGKATLASSAASDLGLHPFDIDSYDISAEGGNAGDVKTEAFLKARVERAVSCGPHCTAVILRHVEALNSDRMITALKEVASLLRVLVVTTTDIDSISDGVRSLFTHELEVVAPDEGEREGILKGVVNDRGVRLAHDVDLASIAVKSAALVAGDLEDIVERASVARQDRLEQLLTAVSLDARRPLRALMRDALVSGGESARCVTKADFDIAVEAARKNFADAIGAPKIPNVSWDDVGGLENVKDAVMETIQLPLERPELFAKGMKKRSGILFYGPPGTGKTLLAKAIATEFSLNFFSVKGPELLNMYIGESEANVRRVFQRARDARPCVVFFDELDSVAPKRGNQGDSGGVMDRIVSQLLAELDGMSDGEEGGSGVFVIGATNRPDLLDQALLRPGRFDKMLYLGVSDTHDKQLTILQALTRKFTMHPETSLRRVAQSLPFTYTGADLYALCSDAMLEAITRQASAVDTKIKTLPSGSVSTAYFFDHLATKEDIAVMVTEKDFFVAQKELVGSVSAKELEHYKRVRQTFEGPSKDQDPMTTKSLPPRVQAPAVDGHVELPKPATRPDMRSRVSTAKAKPIYDAKGKGKGKATQWDSEDDDDDDAYVTSNDFAGTPESRKGGSNGAFGIVGADDDEEIYD